jgi:hypothetical protein
MRPNACRRRGSRPSDVDRCVRRPLPSSSPAAARWPPHRGPGRVPAGHHAARNAAGRARLVLVPRQPEPSQPPPCRSCAPPSQWPAFPWPSPRPGSWSAVARPHGSLRLVTPSPPRRRRPLQSDLERRPRPPPAAKQRNDRLAQRVTRSRRPTGGIPEPPLDDRGRPGARAAASVRSTGTTRLGQAGSTATVAAVGGSAGEDRPTAATLQMAAG